MRMALASLLAVLALPSLAAAGEVEISGFGGYTFPFYSQTFNYDPGPVTVDIPGLSIQQSGTFEMKTKGAVMGGLAVAFFPADWVGFEGRWDNAGISFEVKNPTYQVKATLPPPLTPVSDTLSFDAGDVHMSRAQPFSIDLKLRSSGETRVYVTGGLSYLPQLDFEMTQTIALGVDTVDLTKSRLVIGTVALRARRQPGDDTSHWGGNGALGVRIPLGEHGGLTLEGRGFFFAKQTYEWDASLVDTGKLNPVQKELLNRLIHDCATNKAPCSNNALQPVSFTPWWVQVTLGLSFHF